MTAEGEALTLHGTISTMQSLPIPRTSASASHAPRRKKGRFFMSDRREPGDESMDVANERELPVSCWLIGFDSVHVLYDPILGYPALFVYGEKPYAAMSVELRPFVYVQKPTHWGYEVIGCIPDNVKVMTDVTGPYVVILPLPGASIGDKGIEIVGADQSQELDIDMSKLGQVYKV